MRKIRTEKYYKRLFFIGAVWNWVVAAVLSVGYKWVFPVLGMKLPLYPLFMLMFLGTVALFGIAGYWVSRDLERNLPLVKLLIVGKPFVLIYVLPAVLSGQVPMILIVPAAIDLVFGILYIEFFITYKKTGAPLRGS